LKLRADSAASYSQGRLSFAIDLGPHANWQASLRWVAHLEGIPLPLHADGESLTALKALTFDWRVFGRVRGSGQYRPGHLCAHAHFHIAFACVVDLQNYTLIMSF
jgi:hypothetical protein